MFKYIEFNKGLLLRKAQEKIYVLPSININEEKIEEEKEENKNKKKKEEREEENEEDTGDNFNMKINEERMDELASVNYEDKRNKKLAQNIIKSIL